jgi:hypothetical protein
VILKPLGLAASFLFVLSWQSPEQDVREVISATAKTMGIADLSAVRSFLYSGSGASFEFGQSKAPGAAWPKSPLSSYKRIVDFDVAGSIECFDRPADAKPLNIDFGHPVTGEKGDFERLPFRERYGEEGRQYEIWITPLGFLKGAAADPEASLKSVTSDGHRYSVISFTYPNNPAHYRVSGYINAANILECA